MSNHLYHSCHRFMITEETVAKVRAVCSPGESFSWVGRQGTGLRYRIHTFRGVPAKHVDVLLCDEALPRQGHVLLCDVGRKEGRYDGAVRWRITLRDGDLKTPQFRDLPRGKVFIDEDADGLHFVCTWAGGGMWGGCFPQLRYEVDGRTDLAAVLMHQAINYYPFLAGDVRRDPQVRALAESWAATPRVLAIRDLNLLNRDASRELYALAVSLGWRKLTRAQRLRLGLGPDSRQWQREEYVAWLRQRAGMGTPSGVGRYTLDAASGERLELPAGTCRQCHELTEDCDCVD